MTKEKLGKLYREWIQGNRKICFERWMYERGRASAISEAVEAVEKLRLPSKFAERNRTVDKAIAVLKSLEDKNG